MTKNIDSNLEKNGRWHWPEEIDKLHDLFFSLAPKRMPHASTDRNRKPAWLGVMLWHRGAQHNTEKKLFWRGFTKKLLQVELLQGQKFVWSVPKFCVLFHVFCPKLSNWLFLCTFWQILSYASYDQNYWVQDGVDGCGSHCCPYQHVCYIFRHKQGWQEDDPRWNPTQHIWRSNHNKLNNETSVGLSLRFCQSHLPICQVFYQFEIYNANNQRGHKLKTKHKYCCEFNLPDGISWINRWQTQAHWESAEIIFVQECNQATQHYNNKNRHSYPF